MSSSLAWIRRNYNVPAHKGRDILYRGRPAVIVGGHRQYLRLRVDGKKHPVVTHPTWAITYPTIPLPPSPRGWCSFCLEEIALLKDGAVRAHRRLGAEHFKADDRQCPGAGDKPWAVCSWTIPAPTEEAAA